MIVKKIGILASFLLFGIFFGQKKEQLQKQSAELQKQIANINADLAKTKNESRLSIAYLNNVNKKIALREKVYNNTQKEKRFIEDDIYLRQLEINKLNRELTVLRKNYAAILVNAYKNKGVQNKVTFILSSRSLGEALRRVQYIKQYGEYQDKKAAEISDKFAQIKKSISLKERSKREKEGLLLRQSKELTIIEGERKDKELLLEEFKKNEARLVGELRQKQAESKRLEGEIRRIIAEEIKLAKAKAEAERKEREEKIRIARIAAEKEKARIEEANRRAREAAELAKKKAEAEEKRLAEISRKKAEEERKAIEANNEARRLAAERDAREAAAKAKAAELKANEARAASVAVNKKTEEEKKAAETKTMTAFGVGATVGSNFAENRGRMSFPVAAGQVTQRFGRQAHPVYKGVVIENNGIIIAVSPGTRARAVFPGTVSSVMAAGGAKTVMVRHGEYFTIYSNLSNVYVSKGQQLAAGTLVGEVGADFDGSYSLDFQVWNGANPVDPLGWVSN